MNRLLISLLTALACAGCSSGPDTTLHPDPKPAYAPLRHPFRDATLFRDPHGAALRWHIAHGDPPWLDPIASTPQAIWLTSPQDLTPLPATAHAAKRQHALLVLVAYYIPDRGCTHHKDGAPTPSAYLAWIRRIIDGLRETSAVIILEPDAVPADCFTPERAALLRQTNHDLSAAGHFVYIDAGHPRWKSSGEMAQRLLASGIQEAEGFSVNVSNRQTTRDSHQWGRELSDLVGGREFVIDTSRNGLGPPPDADRNDEWCNPSQQGLGTRPTVHTGLDRAAALLWIKRPGESDGLCGGEKTYGFSPTQAGNLIVHAGWVPRTLRTQAQAATG